MILIFDFNKNINKKKKYKIILIMKKVLITGKHHFIAHHIIANLIKNTDWEIVTIDRLDISGNLNRLNEILEQFSEKDKKRLKCIS